MSGAGRVVSWCTFLRPYYPELPVPWTTLLVELSEGPLVISNPVGFGHDDAFLGMPVVVTFIECEDDNGPFRLPAFQPLRKGTAAS